MTEAPDLAPESLELLAAARLMAFSASPYLAQLLAAMTWVAVPGLGTVAIDPRVRVYVDPEAIHAWGPTTTSAVLLHEAHHVLRGHGERGAALDVTTRDQFRWNMAADCEINDDLVRAKTPLPAGGLVPSDFDLPDGLVAEAYYRALGRTDPPTELRDCGSGAGGARRSWELANDDATVPGLSPIDVELRRRLVAETIRAMPPGTVPGDLRRWAEARDEPQIPWQRVLQAELRRAVGYSRGRTDYTYQRPSRRQPPGPGPRLPALHSPLLEVVVVVDTSASVDGDLLDALLCEVAGVLRSTPDRTITAISCDTTPTVTRRVRYPRDITLVGGGGTDLSAGLEACVGLRPRPNVIIVLTDGDTPWPPAKPNVRGKVIVVSTGAPGPPWATSISLPGPALGHPPGSSNIGPFPTPWNAGVPGIRDVQIGGLVCRLMRMRWFSM